MKNIFNLTVALIMYAIHELRKIIHKPQKNKDRIIEKNLICAAYIGSTRHALKALHLKKILKYDLYEFTHIKRSENGHVNYIWNPFLVTWMDIKEIAVQKTKLSEKYEYLKAAALIKNAECIFNQGIKILFVFSDIRIEFESVIKAALGSKIKVFHIPHALTIGDQNIDGVTNFLAIGKYQLENKKNYPADKIFCFGDMSKPKDNKRLIYPKKIEKILIASSLPLDIKLYTLLIEELLSLEKYIVYFKPHPGTHPEKLIKKFIYNPKFIFYIGELEILWDKVDACISNNSNVSIDAVYMAKYCFSYKNELDLYDFCKNELSYNLFNLEELSQLDLLKIMNVQQSALDAYVCNRTLDQMKCELEKLL